MQILDGRTPLILVSGLGTAATVATRRGRCSANRAPSSCITTSTLREGVVRRTVTTLDGGTARAPRMLELAHGCVSCTLRVDLLPLLRTPRTRAVRCSASCCTSTAGSNPRRVCWAIEHVVVSGVVGQVDGPAARDVRVDGRAHLPRRRTWLADATGDDALDDGRSRRRAHGAQVASGRSTSPTPWWSSGECRPTAGAGPARRGPGPARTGRPGRLGRATRTDDRGACCLESRPARGAVSCSTPTRRCCAGSRR